MRVCVLTHLSPGYRRPPFFLLSNAYPELRSGVLLSLLVLAQDSRYLDLLRERCTQRGCIYLALATGQVEEAHPRQRKAGKNAWPVGVADPACLISWLQKSTAFRVVAMIKKRQGKEAAMCSALYSNPGVSGATHALGPWATNNI